MAKFSEILKKDSVDYLRQKVADRTALDPKGLFFECLVISLFRSKKATYNYWPVDNSQAEPDKLTVQPPADVMTFQDLKGLKEIVNEARVRDVVNKYLVDDEMDEEELTKEQIEQKTRKLILELKMLDEANETGMDSLLEFMDRDQFLLLKQRNFASTDLLRWPKTSDYIELFQITTSKSHPIKLEPLKKIMRVLKWLWGIGQFRLIFVIPNDVPDYGSQNYLGPGKRVIQDQDTLDWVKGHITQWFLGIELRGLDEQEED